MKRLLTAALLAVSALTAVAQTWHMPNNAGDEVVLTTRACERNGETFKILKAGYGYSQSGTRLALCWWIEDGLVHAVWLEGTLEGIRSVWTVDSFTQRGGKGGSV